MHRTQRHLRHRRHPDAGHFAIQHRGILYRKRQKWLAIIVLVPLLIIGLLRIFSGQIDSANVTNLLPPTAAYSGTDGTWSNGGWTLFLGGLYIAAWSTYGFETAVCYTRELKNPKTDTFKAIFYSGLLCCLFFFLIPFTFQGVLGHAGMLAPGIVDGTGVAEALGSLVHGGKIVTQLLVVLMIMALFLAIMTAMAGSSRTLYQGSKDGWLPKYLDHVNEHGAPTRAMWTDFAFNLICLRSRPTWPAISSCLPFPMSATSSSTSSISMPAGSTAWMRSCRAPMEGADLADRPQHGSGLRQRVLPRRWRQGLGLFQRALGRLHFRRAHPAGLRLSPLRA